MAAAPPHATPGFLNRELEHRLRSFLATRCQIPNCYHAKNGELRRLLHRPELYQGSHNVGNRGNHESVQDQEMVRLNGRSLSKLLRNSTAMSGLPRSNRRTPRFRRSFSIAGSSFVRRSDGKDQSFASDHSRAVTCSAVIGERLMLTPLNGAVPAPSRVIIMRSVSPRNERLSSNLSSS